MKIKNSNITCKGVSVDLWAKLPTALKALVRAASAAVATAKEAPAKAKKKAKAPKKIRTLKERAEAAVEDQYQRLSHQVVVVVREATAPYARTCRGYKAPCGIEADPSSTKGYCEGHMALAKAHYGRRHR